MFIRVLAASHRPLDRSARPSCSVSTHRCFKHDDVVVSTRGCPNYSSPEFKTIFHVLMTLFRTNERWFCTLSLLIWLVTLSATAQVTNTGDFTYTTNNGSITITGYAGPPGVVTVPDAIEGLPVTVIGKGAFYREPSVSSVSLPNNVVTIGEGAFWGCTALTNLNLGTQLTTIEAAAFWGCTSLTNLIIPAAVTYIGDAAFAGCTNLTALYFQGPPPQTGQDLFLLNSDPTIYYLPGTGNWGSSFAGQPAEPWVSSALTLTASPANAMTNGFSFTVSGPPDAVVAIETSPSLGAPSWVPVSTNSLVNGSLYFTDPQWTNSPIRFYRARAL